MRQSILLAKDGSDVPVEKVVPFGEQWPRWHRASVITLARDITARLAVEAELRESQEALPRRSNRCWPSAEDRERIARDLHDTVIQRLFAEGMSLQAAMGGVGDPPRTRAQLESVVDGRLDLDHQGVADGGVLPPGRGRRRRVGCGDDCSRWLPMLTDGSGFEPRLQFDGPIESIEVPIADHLIPVLREALSNIAHHAEAGYVRIAVSVADNVTLTVSDDGIGVPAEVLGGRGLTNMAKRPGRSAATSPSGPNPSGGSLISPGGCRSIRHHSRHDGPPSEDDQGSLDNPPASDSTTCQAVVTSVPVITTAPKSPFHKFPADGWTP